MPANKFFMLLTLLATLGNVWNVAEAERQSLTSIALQAESFLQSYPYESSYPIHIELAKLDNRLRLKPCEEALQVKFTRTHKIMGNTSLTVKCATPVNWQIHLPVRVSIFEDVIVNKYPLVKGQTIDMASIEFSKQDISRLQRGFYRSTDTLKNLQAKRNLPARSILNPTNLNLRRLVKSGQEVTIVLKLDGLQIKTTGVALKSASLGQLVKVKNIQSNKIVEGVVSAPGQVTVNL